MGQLLDEFLARDEIRERRSRGHLTPDDIYDLVLRAYGDIDVADRVRAEYALDLMKGPTHGDSSNL